MEQFTQDARVRLRGRSFALRVSSSQKGVGWRLGSPRLDIRPDGEEIMSRNLALPFFLFLQMNITNNILIL